MISPSLDGAALHVVWFSGAGMSICRRGVGRESAGVSRRLPFLALATSPKTISTLRGQQYGGQAWPAIEQLWQPGLL